ncbi:MAG TPA: SRPBCC family protein [Solirubrobacteraceae bacterium]|nr:SRPBCC family protein [Solirubrobacteraceae bacterium]
MKLEQSFTVTAPVEQVWATLIDVERVAPCLPGAEITGQSPEGGYEGTFTVKLGPATAAYRGSLKMESLDEASRTATMSAKGTDKRGQGGATASIVSTMHQEGDDTLVEVVTDFTITGRLARFGRGGMIEDISKRLMRDFAQCLQSTLAAEPAAAAPAESAPIPAASEDEQADAAVASAADAEAGAAAEPPAAAAEPAAAEPAAPAASLADEEPASAAASGEGAASAPLPGEDAADAEPAAPEEAAPATPLGGEEPLVVPEQAVPAAREAAASQEAAPLPGEDAAEAEPPRRAGEADPWGPLSPPAQPATPAEEAPAPRTHSIPPPTARPTPAPAKPVKGFSLLFGVFWDRIKRFFGRLFGRGKD